ncbi:Lrp/AsnC family transcriptional regulator [Natronomonas salsuginis]|uniref:Lrp/AsnC family transcriptional regulator n=1 Tax=Natronomonas salsuginis TaxID=2217661 RepID=A0A4U5JH15_9EURY|nr:Lrp/AsnC family transcriptional regulator [Natronomonas salsuginis]TKR25339.1 Lrp/AsnC family transcriptional regulator [Natronomonas salsuginis]
MGRPGIRIAPHDERKPDTDGRTEPNQDSMDRGLEQAVLELLAEEQHSVSGIADALDRHPVTVDRQCYDLQTDGYIAVATSGGTYRLTAKGRERLAADE